MWSLKITDLKFLSNLPQANELIIVYIISSKLGLHLPHPVDHKNGKAQWDGNKSQLTISLKMTRDYDFMNFW